MSFTVVRYKNGKAIPIKLSIWDAFKGVPDPKPRPPKPCSCCNKVHPKKPRHQESRTQGSSEPTATAQAGTRPNDGITKPSRPRHGTETYSKEDDAKIIEMKVAQNSWKQILATINKKSLSQLKDHWKTIDPQRNDPGNGNGSGSGSGNDEDEKKKAEIERRKAEGQARKQKAKEEQYSSSAMHAAPTAVTLDSLQGRSGGGGGGANELKYLADRYDRHKWMAAASKHFDLTGERITAATARRMAEGN